MATWRIAASNSHLYPGARLRCLDAQGEARFAAGDRVVLEFSDGNIALGEIAQATPQAVRMSVQAHSTGRGAPIAAKAWNLVAGATPGALRILSKA